jgi:hypothetical protein
MSALLLARVTRNKSFSLLYHSKDAPLSTALQSANIPMDGWKLFAESQTDVITAIIAKCKDEKMSMSKHEEALRDCFGKLLCIVVYAKPCLLDTFKLDDSLKCKVELSVGRTSLDAWSLERFRNELSTHVPTFLSAVREALKDQTPTDATMEQWRGLLDDDDDKGDDLNDEAAWRGLQRLLNEPLSLLRGRVALRVRDIALNIDQRVLLAEVSRLADGPGRSPLLSL